MKASKYLLIAGTSMVVASLATQVIAADITPPTLISWSRSPAIVDVTNGSAQIVVEMRIVDDESGTQEPSVSAGSREARGQHTGFASVVRISGSSRDSTWRAILTVPQGSAPGIWDISLFPLSDNQGNSGFFGPGQEFISTFVVAEDGAELPESDFVITLEEPVDGEVHGGVGNLRGWAVASEGITKVEIYIDGKYVYDAPYGGLREDVAKVFPNIPGSNLSGFSLAFGYGDLAVGTHTILARAFTAEGKTTDSSSTFYVKAFHKNFISSQDVVDGSEAALQFKDDVITIQDVSIDGQIYDLTLKWRTAEQGFEIIEIR